MSPPEPVLLGSITELRPEHAGAAALCGSHGGLYAARLAALGGLRAVIFNDAGIGLERAGVAGVEALGRAGLPAAAVDCATARIGDARDMAATGVVSVVTPPAAALGVARGMPAAEAIRRLAAAGPPPADVLSALPETRDARRSARVGATEVSLCDSASLVTAEDEGRVVVTGSHGGLIDGDPARGVKARLRVAVFNDAGVGKHRAGIGRLPALDVRGVAAATVSCRTARIGDAASALETGVISHANEAARRLGAAPGMALKDWLAGLG